MNLFIFIVEVPLILSKDNANRRQCKICKDKNCKFETCFIVEVPLILCRDDKEQEIHYSSSISSSSSAQRSYFHVFCFDNISVGDPIGSLLMLLL